MTIKADEINNIAVIGSGQMGNGIAQVFATQGIRVCLVDNNSSALDKARKGIEKSLTKLAEKGKIQSTPSAILENIKTSTSLKDCAEAQMVIEAVTERENVKAEIFTALDGICGEQTIFASNTSSIPITRLASHTKHPENFIGMHFMNPVPLMKLVEVIPGFATDPVVTDLTIALAERLGKQTVTSQDYPGFIVNRVLMPMINEAFNTLHTGVASAEDIDKGMTLGTNQPMGPLTLADFIGLDTCHSILEVMHAGLGQPHYFPSPMLKKYVEAGFLGRKTGRGVFIYD